VTASTISRRFTPAYHRGEQLPPDPAVQAQFVGSSCEAAIREAFKFYLLTKGYAVALGAPIGMEIKFLDFGVGWGRFLRLFWKDIPGGNLYGCDVDPDILAACRVTGVPGSFDRLYPRGRLPYPDDWHGGGIAYSVFTHLAEEAHLHWMKELARVLRPGAVFCMTLEPRRFIDFLEKIPDNPASAWHVEMRRYAGQADELRRQFDHNRFIYLPTGGGAHRQKTDYGEAIIPLSFIEREWADHFAVRAYIDDPTQYWQAVAVMQRK
jgi:SAM-dependent methyltransferase